MTQLESEVCEKFQMLEIHLLLKVTKNVSKLKPPESHFPQQMTHTC